MMLVPVTIYTNDLVSWNSIQYARYITALFLACVPNFSIFLPLEGPAVSFDGSLLTDSVRRD